MSYDKTKTDPGLGQKVHKHLVSVGVETPVIDNGLSRKEKMEKRMGKVIVVGVVIVVVGVGVVPKVKVVGVQ